MRLRFEPEKSGVEVLALHTTTTIVLKHAPECLSSTNDSLHFIAFLQNSPFTLQTARASTADKTSR